VAKVPFNAAFAEQRSPSARAARRCWRLVLPKKPTTRRWRSWATIAFFLSEIAAASVLLFSAGLRVERSSTTSCRAFEEGVPRVNPKRLLYQPPPSFLGESSARRTKSARAQPAEDQVGARERQS